LCKPAQSQDEKQTEKALPVDSFPAGKQHAQHPETPEPTIERSSSINAVAIDSVFSGGGEMGALIRVLDWSQTALGPV